MKKPLPSKKADVSASKAKTILNDGTVRGAPLTEKQKGMFGAIAGKAPATPKAREQPLAIGERKMGAQPRTAAARKALKR